MKRDKELSLDDRVLIYIRENGATSVQHLYDALRAADSSISELELTDTVWRLVEADKASLNDAPRARASFIQYLSVWETHWDLYASLLIVLVAVLSIYGIPAELPWVTIRWVLGVLIVVFIPGYATTEALFPRIKLDPFERVGLSVGLSFVLAMFVGLLLNFSPWGIRLDPIVAALAVLTVAVTIIALARGYYGQ